MQGLFETRHNDLSSGRPPPCSSGGLGDLADDVNSVYRNDFEQRLAILDMGARALWDGGSWDLDPATLRIAKS